jgi:hypothetical protein
MRQVGGRSTDVERECWKSKLSVVWTIVKCNSEGVGGSSLTPLRQRRKRRKGSIIDLTHSFAQSIEDDNDGRK